MQYKKIVITFSLFFSTYYKLPAQEKVFKISLLDTVRFDIKNYTFKNTKKLEDGIYQVFFDTSKSVSIRYYVTFKNGKKNGKEVFFDGIDSTAILSGNYDRGKKTGIFIDNDVVYGKSSRKAFFNFKADVLSGFAGYYSKSDSMEFVDFNIGSFKTNKKDGIWLTFRRKIYYNDYSKSFGLYKIVQFDDGFEKEKTRITDSRNSGDFFSTKDWFVSGSRTDMKIHHIYRQNKLKCVLYTSNKLDTIMLLLVKSIPMKAQKDELFAIGETKAYSLINKEDYLKISGEVLFCFNNVTYKCNIVDGIMKEHDRIYIDKNFSVDFDILDFVYGSGLK
ncbi:MAG TPA: hypothetical protein VEC12_00045 [Bacteroidia bacterium]|nr:hypothetical protein [Bacteroidia bacterium]